MASVREELFTRLASCDRRYVEVEEQLVRQAAQADSKAYQELSKELAQ